MANGRKTLRAVGDFLAKDGSMSAIRTIGGIVFGAAIGTEAVTSIPALIGMGAGFVGLTGFAHWSIERSRREGLLDTYRTEISHMLGKDEKQLTIQDLNQVAKGPHNPKGSTAIALATKHFRGVRNFFVISQAVTAAIMIATLSAVAAPLLGFAGAEAVRYTTPLGMAGVSGFTYNYMFRTVENVYSFITNASGRGLINQEIRAINEQVALGGHVSATRVLGVMVQADPGLQQAIDGEFGQKYENLSIADQRKAVVLLDPKTQVRDVTLAINSGEILPTELALIAFDESSGTPRHHVKKQVEEMVETVEAPNKQWTRDMKKPEEQHVAQLDLTRELGATEERVIH